jgi:hypothetical protein
MAKLFKEKCIYLVLALFFLTLGLLYFSYGQVQKSHKLVEEVEYIDSLNRYNKIYYDKAFKELKKENKELYDSLKEYKDQITVLIQFKHEKEYNTGKVTTKPIIKDSIVYDTIPITIPQVAKTFEYTSEPNDTFQYKLNVNSFTEPNWYSLQAKVSNKFTIVNKQDTPDGPNHITIGNDNGGTISDVTVFKKKEKRKFLNRFSFGPAVTAGYDVINKQWGIMAGASVTFDLK